MAPIAAVPFLTGAGASGVMGAATSFTAAAGGPAALAAGLGSAGTLASTAAAGSLFAGAGGAAGLTSFLAAQGATTGLGLNALTAMGGGLSALQTLGQASYQSSLQEHQARQEGINAEQATLNARGQAVALRRRNNIEMGEMVARQFAIGQGSGSGATARQNARDDNRFDVDSATISGALQASGHRGRATGYRDAASNTRRRGIEGAIGTLYGTGVKIREQRTGETY